jgi:polysaccharide pyruvyl transferase WcaK-like protein
MTAGPAGWQERVTAGRIESIGDLSTEIAQTDVVVATRYHNVVCALMLGRPVISLGYAQKNDFLLSDMGLQAYCQHVETFTVAKLIQQFEALSAELEAASARIQAVNLRFRQQLDEQYAGILQPARAAEPLPAV